MSDDVANQGGTHGYRAFWITMRLGRGLDLLDPLVCRLRGAWLRTGSGVIRERGGRSTTIDCCPPESMVCDVSVALSNDRNNLSSGRGSRFPGTLPFCAGLSWHDGRAWWRRKRRSAPSATRMSASKYKGVYTLSTGVGAEWSDVWFTWH
jgi:hypothetical protein